MTLDERLEALTQNTEILQGMVRDLDGKVEKLVAEGESTRREMRTLMAFARGLLAGLLQGPAGGGNGEPGPKKE